jgi:hypothetical protein
MSLQGNLSIERMCELGQVSRAGFYRSLQQRMPVEEEMEVRSAIQQIVLEHRRRYGYRRVAAEQLRSSSVYLWPVFSCAVYMDFRSHRTYIDLRPVIT